MKHTPLRSEINLTFILFFLTNCQKKTMTLVNFFWNIMIHHNDTYNTVLYLYTSFYLLRLEIIPLNLLKTKLNNDLLYWNIIIHIIKNLFRNI